MKCTNLAKAEFLFLFIGKNGFRPYVPSFGYFREKIKNYGYFLKFLAIRENKWAPTVIMGATEKLRVIISKAGGKI